MVAIVTPLIFLFQNFTETTQAFAPASLPRRALSAYGAKGDGFTDDTQALRNAFAQSGVALDGEGKSYLVKGTLSANHDFALFNATLIQTEIGYITRTLLLTGTAGHPINVWLQNLKLDLRGDEHMGSLDSSGIWLSYTQPVVHGVEIKGTLGTGYGFMASYSQNGLIADLYVHDLTWQPYQQDKPLDWTAQSKNWGTGSSQTLLVYQGLNADGSPNLVLERMNEPLAGIFNTSSHDMKYVRPRVENMNARFSDGTLYPYQADGLDVATGSENVTILGAQIHRVWEGIDSAGSPTKNVVIRNSVVTDVFSYAYKFANSVETATVVNSKAARCGLACFVVGGLSSVTGQPATNNIWFSNISATDAGVGPDGRNLWAGLATTAGIRIMSSSFPGGDPSHVRIMNAQINSSYTNYGIHSEVDSGALYSDVVSNKPMYNISASSTDWAAIGTLFESYFNRPPWFAEQSRFFSLVVDNGYSMKAIEAIIAQGAHSPVHTTPTPTPQSGSCSYNGGTVENGNAIVAYQQGGLPSGYSCLSPGFYEVRVCHNGTLTGSYNNASCSVEGSVGNACNFNGRSLAHGNAVVAYQQGSLPSGYDCNSAAFSQIRICNNGTLSGSYQNSQCRIVQ